MSGTVNGAIAAKCPHIQSELRAFLKESDRKAVKAGTVVPTTAGSLPFQHIVHAVAIDPFYDSSVELVTRTIAAAIELGGSLGAKSVATPTLATGYGPLSVAEFAEALSSIASRILEVELLTVVVRNNEDAELIRQGVW